jgi:hypothetical protein
MGVVFDSQLKVWMMITGSVIPTYIDDIETEVLKWSGTTASLHKYGGIQFNYHKTEIGHIHSNGLLDIRLDVKTKRRLLTEGKIEHHHTFIKSGWISFYIRNPADKQYAIELIRIAYCKKRSVDLLINDDYLKA